MIGWLIDFIWNVRDYQLILLIKVIFALGFITAHEILSFKIMLCLILVLALTFLSHHIKLTSVGMYNAKCYHNYIVLQTSCFHKISSYNVHPDYTLVNFSSIFEPRHDTTNKMSVYPPKSQISLGIRPVWSESSLYVQWIAKDPSFLYADSEGFDQTGRMPRLIWVFAGRTATLLVLSWGGSFHHNSKTTICGMIPVLFIVLG